jgi:hypothetical protein
VLSILDVWALADDNPSMNAAAKTNRCMTVPIAILKKSEK